MFPLPLLSTVSDNLEKMKPRVALQYQNTFMKNALIRALNIVYEVAPKVATGSHPKFQDYLEYVGIVCDMVCLHIQGDEVFFKAVSKQCKSFSVPKNKSAAVVQDALAALRRSVKGWKENGKTYQPSLLRGSLISIEAALVEVLHKQVVNFKSDALPQSVTDEQLDVMIKDNMVWLATKSDMYILLPFCMSHHDPKTSKYWPTVGKDAIQAMPDLANAHPNLWKFAPFDPVSKNPSKKLTF